MAVYVCEYSILYVEASSIKSKQQQFRRASPVYAVY